MSEVLKSSGEWSALFIEALGVAVIVISAIYCIFLGIKLSISGSGHDSVYRTVRQKLGRGILLGLELLVAADIIHTVAVELTPTSVAVLGMVVVIRTFLSFTLEVELTGKWPWQQSANDSP